MLPNQEFMTNAGYKISKTNVSGQKGSAVQLGLGEWKLQGKTNHVIEAAQCFLSSSSASDHSSFEQEDKRVADLITDVANFFL